MKLLALLIVITMLFACTSVEEQRDSAPLEMNVDIHSIGDAQPKDEPFSRYGNPPSYSVFGKTYHVLKTNKDFKQKGDASWYGTKFHGRRASSGETYDMYAMTAAHKTLPLPTYVKVTNLDNNKQIIVKVNDRGPFHTGRIIDLSYVAALKLDIVKHGTGRVVVEAFESSAILKPKRKKLLFVQIGAFSEKQNAQRIHEKLAASAINSNIYRVPINAEKTLYRVRIGPFEQRNEAESMLNNVEDLGINDAKVFSDN